jgi:hypothetical protein
MPPVVNRLEPRRKLSPRALNSTICAEGRVINILISTLIDPCIDPEYLIGNKVAGTEP